MYHDLFSELYLKDFYLLKKYKLSISWQGM